MKRLFLAAGVAALAITVPAAADPGKNQGGKGRDRGAQVQKDRGGGKAKAREARKQFAEQRQKKAERGKEFRKQAAERNKKFNENRFEARKRVAERIDKAQEKAFQRQEKRFERRAKVEEKLLDRIAERPNRRLARLAERRVVPLREWDDLARGGVWVDGCPPGLAKKPVACVPPGQVKNIVGEPLSVLSNRIALQQVPVRLRSVYADTDDYYYRFGNGYAYRVNRSNDLVSALLPLFGLGLTAGQPFPTAYSNYYMPAGLQSFYPDTPYTSYRYANGYVYQIDPITGLIEDVDPMLGYGFGYGQMMPITYSAYNVPYQYRPLYQDTSAAYYRYAPGAIYQVDPTTSLITGVAALLSGGLNVGQPLPMGYSAYNVPYQYRTTYYDSPDAWYRYANGYVYRVDPTTQLVTAIVASLLT